VSSKNLLEMTGITKRFPGVLALDKVDFSVKSGETRCLIGANGAGKSTLMKILSGAYKSDEGRIVFDGVDITSHSPLDIRRNGVSIIYQELSLIDSLSVAENIALMGYSGPLVRWPDIYSKAAELCQSFGIQLDVKRPVSELSIGQKQLVEIFKALAEGAKLIVMDEPSATLSENEFSILLSIIKDLKEHGVAIIYITHRLEELFLVGDSVSVFFDGKHIGTMDIEDTSVDRLVEMMIGHKLELWDNPNLQKVFDEPPILSLTDVESDKVGPVSFDVHRGEILGIYGLVGSGRTEIMRTIFGADRMVAGEITYQGKTYVPQNPHHAISCGIGLLPENRKLQGLVQKLPIWENSVMPSLNTMSQRGFLKYKKIRSTADSYFKKLSVRAPSINTICSSLSGGNQQKVVMAKWLIRQCDLLLVDEPTQGIDVGAKDQIYQILNEAVEDRQKSVIIVSSELNELLKVCNRVVTLYEGKIVDICPAGSENKERILHAALTGESKL
jgi:ribose transport system ATP-binding protein